MNISAATQGVRVWTLKQMTMENFKGMKKLVVNFSDRTRIYGANGAGKTTIPDAFSWVLWNKDSQGNAPGTDKFREKPVDQDGKEIHNLDTMVELRCLLNGKPFNLKRVQRENWVKKRGGEESMYQGNVSTYWINDVETKLTDFKARIASVVSEEVSWLIGSLPAFNAIEQKKRRQLLMELSGVDIDARLLERDEYRPLADRTAEQNVSVDELRKVLNDQKKRMKVEIGMIPVRIDEARKALPEFKEHEVADAEYLISDMGKSLAQCEALIAQTKAESSQSGVQGRILTLEAEAVSLKRGVMDVHRADRRQHESQAAAASDAHRRATNAAIDTKRRLQRDKERLERVTIIRDNLRQQYTTEYEKKFTFPDIGTCPTCGQSIPAEQHQATRDDAQARFNTDRLAALTSIRKQGVEAGEEVNALTESISRMEADIDALDRQIESALSERDSAYARLKELPLEPNYDTEPRIKELERQIEALRSELSASPEEKIRKLEARKQEITETIARAQRTLARRDSGKETERRIKQLEGQQKEKAAEFAEVERMIALVEKFVQDRCAALEESINDRFPTLRWKLFKEQINGGIEDVCVCMIPCATGLVTYGGANEASNFNANVEIVNVLSEHYKIRMPLFADRTESINRIAPVQTQLITLAVSTDSELRIEHDKEEAA